MRGSAPISINPQAQALPSGILQNWAASHPAAPANPAHAALANAMMGGMRVMRYGQPVFNMAGQGGDANGAGRMVGQSGQGMAHAMGGHQMTSGRGPMY